VENKTEIMQQVLSCKISYYLNTYNESLGVFSYLHSRVQTEVFKRLNSRCKNKVL